MIVVIFLQTLKQPLFMEYKERILFYDNHFLPCPMLENPKYIEEMAKRTEVKSTDLQSPEDVEDLVAKTKLCAEQWKDKVDELWQEVLEEKEEIVKG
ncbi:hypothetical protein [Tepidimicrobium xylanilyticum]|uniref:hypothetical protein n=1 Tax=Tepidimicrobium xylanilyticum TaxID=1123352 RepID=UPI00264DDB7A|nr:hypothetical protein [Tepidimicrobium xylanilyticum]GMG96575.1 hypothetical protein EN5CB1_14010 [Tepidimicrobium xylanilyticum]